MAKVELTEEMEVLLKSVYDDCVAEDKSVRERQIRQWRRLKLLWEGFQRIWYSEVAHDWRIWDETQDADTDQGAYDKPINVYRAYLESIIAALSVTVPPIKCFPDDADNTLDIATAKAGDKISQLVYRHSNASLIWIHALFIFATEGMTAFHNYSKCDKSYGTYTKTEYENVDEFHKVTTCPACGFPMDDEIDDQLRDKFGKDDTDVKIDDELNEDNLDLCPNCLEIVQPTLSAKRLIVPKFVGSTNEPKARVCIEVYGGLYVKVPSYARGQADCPYLILSREIDYTIAMDEFQHLRGSKKLREAIKGNHGSYENYDQWGRLSPQYQGEFPTNVVTKHQAWIRPAKFNILADDRAVNELKKKFPDGVRVVYINDSFAEAHNECLDDYWTLTENPLSDYLHFDPLGQSLVSIQEITNDLISLVLQTIEHGISQTFADPGVLNFDAYGQTETTPGGVFPATPKTGKSLADGFFEMRTATLSSEVIPFSTNIQSLGQLVSGALPSLFGGSMQGTETASQYSMSRAQALQRLQNNWKLFTTTWKTLFSKVVPMYIKGVKEDEKDVQKLDDGNFVNVFIRKADLEGKVGKVELEANENLPMTWSQIKDTVMELFKNGNPEVLKILAAPENISLLHDALGIVDLFVPNEDSMIKQYDEIKILLDSQPIPTGMDPETGEEFIPSVEIDPIYDNNEVEFEICRKWITSEAGRQTKQSNPEGYMNVLLHGKLHFTEIQNAMMAEQMASQEQGAAPGKKPNSDLDAPIKKDSDVKTNV